MQKAETGCSGSHELWIHPIDLQIVLKTRNNYRLINKADIFKYLIYPALLKIFKILIFESPNVYIVFKTCFNLLKNKLDISLYWTTNVTAKRNILNVMSKKRTAHTIVTLISRIHINVSCSFNSPWSKWKKCWRPEKGKSHEL